MKRILMGVLLCMLTLSAYPWAELSYSVTARYSSDPELKPEYQCLLPRIVSGQSIEVNILTDSEEEYQRLQEQIRDSYGRWFSNAVNTIKQQGREEQFQDVLPVLQKGVSLNFTKVSSSEAVPSADLTVQPMDMEDLLEERVNQHFEESIAGAFVKFRNKEPMKLIMLKETAFRQNEEALKVFEALLDHELGHTLGLADHYKDKRGLMPHVSRVWRSHENGLLGASRSVMDQPSETSPRVPTVEDADGLINIVDSWTIYYLRQDLGDNWKDGVSKRILEGWDSLRRNEMSGSSAERYRLGTAEEYADSVPNSNEEYKQMIERRKAEAEAYRKSLGL